MPDYEKKAEVISNGFYDTFRSINKACYYGIESAFEWRTILCDSDPDSFLECVRLNNADYQRIKRLRKKIVALLSQQCIFVTLTFNDDTLEKTSAKTRRRYVSRFLNQYGLYVGNIDFGAKNKREHYHAVVQADKIDYSEWHSYGALKGELIRDEPDDYKRLAKYVAKLTNHAIKETTKRTHLIYSRN